MPFFFPWVSLTANIKSVLLKVLLQDHNLYTCVCVPWAMSKPQNTISPGKEKFGRRIVLLMLVQSTVGMPIPLMM